MWRCSVVLVGLAVLLAACGGSLADGGEDRFQTPSGDEGSDTESVSASDEVEAVPMETVSIPSTVGQLSPDGNVLVIDRDGSTCAVSIETEQDLWCNDNGFEIGSNDHLVFAPDSATALFSPAGNPDVSLLDVQTGEIRVLTDDGLADLSPDGLGVAPRDYGATWIDRSKAVFYRLADGLVSLVRLDVERGDILATEPLPTQPSRNGDPRPESIPILPPVVSGERAYVGGNGRILVYDVGSLELVDTIDYEDQYDPVAPNMSVLPALQPVALDGRTLIVFDPAIDTLFKTSVRSGGTSGVYLLDTVSGELAPLFSESPTEGGWVGPISIGVAGDGSVVVQYVSGSRIYEPAQVPHLPVGDVVVDSGLPLTPDDLRERTVPAGYVPTRGASRLPLLSVSSAGTVPIVAFDEDTLDVVVFLVPAQP